MQEDQKEKMALNKIKEKKNKSEIWEYYEKIKETIKEIDEHTSYEVVKTVVKNTKCKICSTILVYNNKTKDTSAMINHLVNKHIEIANKVAVCQNKIKAKEIKNTEQKQSTIPFKPKLGKERKELIINSIARIITEDMRPLNITISKGFAQFVKIMESDFVMPSRSTFRYTIIPKKYEKIKLSIIEDISKVDFFGVSFDAWTNINMTAFITILIHYIDQYFNWKNLVLKTFKVTESQTADYISEKIMKILLSFGLDINHKKFFSISDCGANMIKTSKLLHIPHVPCFAHILHNTLKTIVSIPEIESIVAKSRKMVSFFKVSYKRNLQLKLIQKKLNISELALKLDCDQRWNSLYLMINRLIELKSALVNYSLEEKKQKFAKIIFESSEWNVLQELQGFLSPFYKITCHLCSALFPSISALNPIINNIIANILCEKETDNILIKQWKAIIKKDFIDRIKPLQHDPIKSLLDLSSALDPRFKNLDFIDQNQKKIIIQKLKEVWNEETEKNPELLKTFSNRLKFVPIKKLKVSENNMQIEDIYGSNINQKQEKDESKVKNDFDAYLLEEQINILNKQNEPNNPLEWWRNNQQNFPILSRIVKRYLSIPATSVECERIFSKAGYLMNKSRASLGEKMLDMILFLCKNEKIFII